MSEPPARRDESSPTRDDVQALTEAIASDVEVRKRELDVQAQWHERNFAYAHSALDVQAKDLGEQRAHDWKVRKLKYGYIAAAGLVLVGFLVYTIQTGNQEIASDLLKVALGALAGGGVMWGYRRSAAGQSDGSQ